MVRGIYRERWQYWAPWSVTQWWKPSVQKAGDEFCNRSILAVVPLAGAFVWFWERQQRNVMDDDYPCERCRHDVWKHDLEANPYRWLNVAWCDVCMKEWWLPRDRDVLMCEHVADTYGTHDVRLAYHVWQGGHRLRNCVCQKRHWFSPEHVLLAVAAKQESDAAAT